MKTLGERLVHARKTRGYTQAQLAEASFVSRAVIANIETNRFTTQMVVLVAICDALNINKDWLINGTGSMEPDNNRAKILDELYQVCSTLTEAQQLFLLDTIKSMQRYLEPVQPDRKQPFELKVAEAKQREREQSR